jgi:Glycosyltransferase family 87
MPTKTRRRVAVFLGTMILIHGLMWWRLRGEIRAGYPDFTSFYAAGKIVARGIGHSLYDESTEWSVQREFASGVTTRKASLPYVHAPFEAWIFVPLSVLPYTLAYLLWDLINAAILISVWFLLRPRLAAVRRLNLGSWLFVSFAFLPVLFTMIQGQDALVLLLVYTLAYLALRNGADFLAGCWLALGLFRFHLVIPFVAILVLAKKWKAVVGVCCGSIPIFLLSAAIVGWRGVLRYPSYIWNLEQHTGRGILLPRDTPSFRGLLEDLLSRWLSAPQLLAVIILVSFVAIWIAVRTWNLAGDDEASFNLAFCVSLLATELVSYHTFIYDFSILLLPIVIAASYMNDTRMERESRCWLLTPIAALFFTPLYLFVWLNWRRSDLMGLVLVVFAAALLREVARMRSLRRSHVSLEAVL